MKKRVRYFAGKVVWITGASGGIGAALTRALASADATLIISSRNTERLESLRDELGGAIRVLPLDLADSASIAGKVKEAIGCFGRIDILINNAGVSQRSELHQTGFSVIRSIMQVNFTGPAELATLLLPHLYSRGSGQIVALSSLMGKFGTPLRTGYCASKFAIQGFYEALAIEALSRGVSVTLIVPGWIRTDISRHALSGDGTQYGVFDPGVEQAGAPEAHVGAMLDAIARRRFESFVALNAKTRAALFLKRFFPRILRLALSKMKVT